VNYIGQYNLANQPEFQARVLIALVRAAVSAVSKEETKATAKAILDEPEKYAVDVALIAATNKSIVRVGLEIEDEDLQHVVDGIFQMLAL